MKYIPFAIIYAGAFPLDNDIILVCIEKRGGWKIRWTAWGGTWFEQHGSIQGGEMRESICQVQFGWLVLGTNPVLKFIRDGDWVIDTSGGFNSAKVATILLATDVDYTNGTSEAKVMRKQCELFARPICHRICRGYRIQPLGTIDSAFIVLGLLGLCAPVDWGQRARVDLRCQKVGTNGEICEQR